MAMAMVDVRRSAAVEASLLVAAIDFGTAFSKCAFCFKSDFERKPCSITCLNLKTGQPGRETQSGGVPTCILFTPEKHFHSFGFNAQRKFSELRESETEDARKWFYFDFFKMKLLTQQRQGHTISRDLDLLDITKRKTMKAMDVFFPAIRHLKELLLSELQKQDTRVEPADILWVLTVPAIWDDAARQFMREAAYKAGIAADRLQLALEPEVASVFCHFHFQTVQESFTQRGQRFMTVDCGGGTVDISVFEVTRDGRLNQLHRPHGKGCGGTRVDEAFKDLLHKILKMDGLAAINNIELVDLMENFEEAKQMMGTSDSVFIKLPDTMKESVGIQLNESQYREQIKLVGPNLRLPREIYTSFFKESKEGIIAAMHEVLDDGVGDVDVILLVGGLSKSPIIQEAVRKEFPVPGKRVQMPPSPDLTVLMGAVQFGHCPQAISTRVSPYTYGVNTTFVYRPGDDSTKVFKTDDGLERTRDIFEILIGIKEMVGIEQEQQYKTFRPTHSQQKKMKFDLYRTESPEPKYVTDPGCLKVGTIEVNMPDLRDDKKRKVQMSISVNGPELKVVARDSNTREEFVASCDFLGGERQ